MFKGLLGSLCNGPMPVPQLLHFTNHVISFSNDSHEQAGVTSHGADLETTDKLKRDFPKCHDRSGPANSFASDPDEKFIKFKEDRKLDKVAQ